MRPRRNPQQEPAVFAKRAVHVCQDLFILPNVLQDVEAIDEVEGVGCVELTQIQFAELQIGKLQDPLNTVAYLQRVFLSVQSLLAHVHPQDAGVGAPASHIKGKCAVAAAGVQDRGELPASHGSVQVKPVGEGTQMGGANQQDVELP